MLTLVIPVYRNEDSLDDLLQAVEQLDATLRHNMEAIFVIDGSPDRCYEILRQRLACVPFQSKLILLTRNFGSFAAIRMGLAHGTGQYFAVMAADLQEPPELVLQIHATMAADAADVVVAARQFRQEPWHKRIPSTLFWWFYKKYVIPEIPHGGVDIFGCNRIFRDTLLTLEERHSSLIAQIFWLGFRRAEIGYTRLPRKHGTSAWTWHKKITYLMDSVFSFSDLPIRMLIKVGGIGALLACVVGLVILIARLVGIIEVPGYTMTMLTLVFFGTLNLLGLGVIGSYAWRAHENTKARPLALCLKIEQFPKPPHAIP